jgi:hypothetical protein
MSENDAPISLKKFDDIHSVSEAEILLIQRQSALLLQKRSDGFNGEMKSSGAIVENYVKGLIQKQLPHGYRICSGYIATADTFRDPKNLIQHDIIIVDDRVPPLYKFGVGDIEVVAAEAVCGIVEVKRTLTKETLRSAIAHLRHTKEILEKYDGGVKSKTKALSSVVGVTMSIATTAPFYVVIGLDALKELTERKFFDEELLPALHEFLDMVWAPMAPFLSVIQWQSRGNKEQFIATNASRNDPVYEIAALPALLFDFETKNSAHIYRKAIFCLRTWINNTAGVGMTPEKNARYFDIL